MKVSGLKSILFASLFSILSAERASAQEAPTNVVDPLLGAVVDAAIDTCSAITDPYLMCVGNLILQAFCDLDGDETVPSNFDEFECIRILSENIESVLPPAPSPFDPVGTPMREHP